MLTWRAISVSVIGVFLRAIDWSKDKPTDIVRFPDSSVLRAPGRPRRADLRERSALFFIIDMIVFAICIP
jgi:hypothetical protein